MQKMEDSEETRGGPHDTRRGNLPGGVSVLTPISHPVLRSVDPVKIAEFVRERKRYEIEITEVPKLTKASFEVSIDPGLLRRMHFLGRLDGIAPGKEVDALTSTDIHKFIKSLVEKEDVSFDPSIIERALKGLKMQSTIADPEARVLEYANEFLTRLESVGYESFKDKNPKETVKLLQRYITPRSLKKIMQKDLECSEDIQQDVKRYVNVLCDEAVAHGKKSVAEDSKKNDAQKSDSTNMNDAKKSDSTNMNDAKKNDSTNKKNRRNGGSSDHVLVSRRRKARTKRKKGKKAGRRPPLCLNPKHAAENKHCHMNACEITPPREAKRLLQVYRKNRIKEAGAAKKVKPVENPDEENSALLAATFACLVRRAVCAEIGSEINLMPPDVFDELCKKEAVMNVKVFDVTRRYALAAMENPEGLAMHVECDKQVTLNVQLVIRHGFNLELRNMTWYVTMSGTGEPLLGRPTLEALGIKTRDFLAAAIDQHRKRHKRGQGLGYAVHASSADRKETKFGTSPS